MLGCCRFLNSLFLKWTEATRLRLQRVGHLLFNFCSFLLWLSSKIFIKWNLCHVGLRVCAHHRAVIYFCLNIQNNVSIRLQHVTCESIQDWISWRVHFKTILWRFRSVPDETFSREEHLTRGQLQIGQSWQVILPCVGTLKQPHRHLKRTTTTCSTCHESTFVCHRTLGDSWTCKPGVTVYKMRKNICWGCFPFSLEAPAVCISFQHTTKVQKAHLMLLICSHE